MTSKESTFKCSECRQKFDTEEAVPLHRKFSCKYNCIGIPSFGKPIASGFAAPMTSILGGEAASPTEDIRRRLIAIYQTHNLAKHEPSIEELLSKYKHDPRLLYTKVCKKYNVKADPAAGWVPCAAFTLGACLKGSSCSYLHEEGAEGTKAFKATPLFPFFFLDHAASRQPQQQRQ